MEPLVRLAWLLAGRPVGARRRVAAARRQPGRAGPLPPRSFRRQAASPSTGGPLAILVHHARREAPDRPMVAARAAGPLRASTGPAGRLARHYPRRRGAARGPDLGQHALEVASQDEPDRLVAVAAAD